MSDYRDQIGNNQTGARAEQEISQSDLPATMDRVNDVRLVLDSWEVTESNVEMAFRVIPPTPDFTGSASVSITVTKDSFSAPQVDSLRTTYGLSGGTVEINESFRHDADPGMRITGCFSITDTSIRGL